MLSIGSSLEALSSPSQDFSECIKFVGCLTYGWLGTAPCSCCGGEDENTAKEGGSVRDAEEKGADGVNVESKSEYEIGLSNVEGDKAERGV